MSWINIKSRRSFDFVAPYNEEGERVVTIPFPVAVAREVSADGVVHDANPALVRIAPEAETTIDVEVAVQPGSLMIVHNSGSAVATVGDVNCAALHVTTLMWDGNAYVELSSSQIV